MRIGVAAACLGAMLATVAGAQDFVWWEAEQPEQANFPERTWFDPQDDEERDKLSGGDWLTHIDERPAGSPTPTARYVVDVSEAGAYALWARKMWKHGPFRWRFDGGAWRTCGRDVELADSVTLRTHVPANWVHLGDVELGAGRHRFEIELLAGVGDNQAAGFDCFMLIDGPFVPRGKLKPGVASGKAAPGWFAFEPGLDEFGDDALLDLRSMNERRAGMHGPLRRDGAKLVRGDGRPIRLWAANLSASNAGQNRASVDYLARKLAKLGFNAVRYHAPLYDQDDREQVDADKLDDLHYLVHAMNRQGIYVELSFYFPLWFDARAAGLPGFDAIDNTKPFGLIFFDEAFQRMHRNWLREMLTRPDPYAGQPLAENPGVGIVEVLNEDSLFFWTFSKKNIPPRYWRQLERRFGRWLNDRYGTIAGAYDAWGGARLDEDAGQSMAIREAWHMTAGALSGKRDAEKRRLRDQVRFLAELQRGFYEQSVRFIRSLGYEGLIAASNWKTADPGTLDRVERWTYTAADVIDRHAYIGPTHEGEGASYSVRVGHRYEDLSGLRHPDRFPVAAAQVAGYPQIISELGWPQPNRYRTEWLPMSAAYAAHQGIDGLFHFAVGSNYLLDQSMTKFQFCSPAVAYSSPAAALIYRRGDVPTAPPAAISRIDADALFSLDPEANVAVAAALDALRADDAPAMDMPAASRAFLAGPIARVYGNGQPALNPAASALPDHLRWDIQAGRCVIDTPKARGIVGFMKTASQIALGGLTIQTHNDYGCILVVSLDDKPIETSDRLLVQAMTEERPYGFKTRGDRITDLGGAPFNVRHIDARITLPDADVSRAVALDPHGRARTDQAPALGRQAATGRVTISLVKDAIYHVVER